MNPTEGLGRRRATWERRDLGWEVSRIRCRRGALDMSTNFRKGQAGAFLFLLSAGPSSSLSLPLISSGFRGASRAFVCPASSALLPLRFAALARKVSVRPSSPTRVASHPQHLSLSSFSPAAVPPGPGQFPSQTAALLHTTAPPFFPFSPTKTKTLLFFLGTAASLPRCAASSSSS